MKIIFPVLVIGLLALTAVALTSPAWGTHPVLPFVSNTETLVRLAIAALLGAFIGLERTIAHKEAGLRTFSIIALGACAFTLLGYFSYTTIPDPGRAVSQLVVGISFLGAGVILFQQDRLRGLTTAASMWVAAGVGAGAGLGMYAFSFFTTALILLILRYLVSVENNVSQL